MLSGDRLNLQSEPSEDLQGILSISPGETLSRFTALDFPDLISQVSADMNGKQGSREAGRQGSREAGEQGARDGVGRGFRRIPTPAP